MSICPSLRAIVLTLAYCVVRCKLEKVEEGREPVVSHIDGAPRNAITSQDGSVSGEIDVDEEAGVGKQRSLNAIYTYQQLVFR